MTEALLLLTGGRSIPDMLVVKHLVQHKRPDIIVNITTERGLQAAKYFQKFVYDQFGKEVKILDFIDPYEKESIIGRCEEALQLASSAEWIMHSTTAPKVVGIYAHDVARKHGIPYWIVDTSGQQLISLITEQPTLPQDFFKLTVREYMGAYGRNCIPPKGSVYQSITQSWSHVTQLLLDNHEKTQILLAGLHKALHDKHPLTPSISTLARTLIETLADYGFLQVTDIVGSEIQCNITNEEMWMFLRGDWLESYVWQEATNANFADDCQWGQRIEVDQKTAKTLPSNEIDVALTYKARLLIVECKTSKKPFGEPEDLDKLYSIANLLGGDFVKQVFVTSCPKPDGTNKGLEDQFNNFKRQAEVRRITVVTGDQLHRIGALLKEEIGADKLIYPTIHMRSN